MKILVVDESVTRRVVVHALKVINVEVISAEDGNQALELAQDETPALAFIRL